MRLELKLFALISLFVLGYMVGYNKGVNDGETVTIKFNPKCKN